MLTGNINDKQLNALVNKIKVYQVNVKKRVDEALALGAIEITNTAKQLSPVDTGLNRASIQSIRESYLRYKVSANTKYAVHLEYGTVKMPAQPFMFPALEAHRQQILANVREAIKFKR